MTIENNEKYQIECKITLILLSRFVQFLTLVKMISINNPTNIHHLAFSLSKLNYFRTEILKHTTWKIVKANARLPEPL